MSHSSRAKVHSISEGRNSKQPPPQQGSRQQKEAPSQKPATSVNPIQPQDQRATGANGAMKAKVLRYNTEAGHARRHPETPAGQHATGSFPTGTEDNRGKR